MASTLIFLLTIWLCTMAIWVIPMQSVAFINLANVQIDLENYDQAQNFAHQALRYRINAYGEKDPGLIDIYNVIGGLKNDLNQYDSAKYYFKKSIALIKIKTRLDDISYTNTLSRFIDLSFNRFQRKPPFVPLPIRQSGNFYWLIL